MSFGNFLRGIASQATQQNYQNVVDVCNRTYNTVTSAFSSSKKVEVLSDSKINALQKCDGSMYFSIYAEKSRNPLYYVVYVPRFMAVFRSKERQEADSTCARFNELVALATAIEKTTPQQVDVLNKMEKLQESVVAEPGYRAIHHASACGFTEAIFELCSSMDPELFLNDPSYDGRLPLQIAAGKNEQDTLVALLNLGANIQKQDCHGCNVVHYAAQTSIVLLETLAKYETFRRAIDMLDENGRSPLCYALLAGQPKCAASLLRANCSKGPFPFGPLVALIPSCPPSSDLLDTIDAILLYHPSFLSEELRGPSTVLHQELDSMVLNHILERAQKGVNVNMRDGSQQTPLHCCVRRNNLSQALTLLAYEADVNAKDQTGSTALHIAVEVSTYAKKRIGKDVYSKNKELHILQGNDGPRFRKVVNPDDHTQKSLGLVKLLLCFNTDVTAKNNAGLTPFDLAKKCSGSQKKEILEAVSLFVSPPVYKFSPENVLADFMQERAFKAVQAIPESERKGMINALSLDGGGIKGLILVQTLLHIQSVLGSPIMDHFSWIAGTSTGAIMALSVARGDSLESCRGLYLKMKDRVFCGKRPYSEVTLEQFLQKHFGDECRMSHISSKRVMVTATSVKTNPPELKLFRNYLLPLSDKENSTLGFVDPKTDIVWKCARCSSAAPTFFPSKDGLVDGGLIANNPTLDLLSDIHAYNAASAKMGQKENRLGCVLSVGTGVQPAEEILDAKFSFSTTLNPFEGYNMIRDALNLKNILIEQITSSDGECVKRARAFAHSANVPFFRFSPHLSSHVELDEKKDEVIVEFLWNTENYLRTSGRLYVKSLVDYLQSLKQTEE